MTGGGIGWFALFSGAWGVAMIAIFIQAIRLSYRIGALARSRQPDRPASTGHACPHRRQQEGIA